MPADNTDSTDLILKAIGDASPEDIPPAEDADDATDSPEPVESEVPLETEAKPAEEAPVALEPDDIEKELAAMGINPPVEGQRENRLPYSRMRKIYENARKKWVDEHSGALKEREDKLAKLQEEAEAVARTNELIRTDPERFLRSLAAINPTYARYLTPAQVAEAAKPAEQDPMPMPDASFPDGTQGYSLEGQQKLIDWQRRQTIRQVTAEMEKRYGPIEQDWKAHRMLQQKSVAIKQQLEAARQTWGTMLDDHQKEIVDALAKYPEMAFEAVVARVLYPKIQADRVKMRQDILKELNERPKAATRTATAPAKSTSDAPLSTEEIILQQIANLR